MEQSQITYSEKISELRLDFDHPQNNDVSFIFVEGKSDVKLYRKFFDLSCCKVEWIPGGKIKLEKCISDLLEIKGSIIGIRDADFLHLKDDNYTKKNIFLTDCHDVEMMMLNDEEVLNSVLSEYLDNKPPENFLENKLTLIKKLSYLKYLNSIDLISIKFTKEDSNKSVSLDKLFDFKNNKFDFEGYLLRLSISKSEFRNIKNKIEEGEVESFDLLQLTNGHDLSRLLDLYFRDFGENIKNGDSEKALRLSYSFFNFQKTKLYNNIKKWSLSNDRTLLKESEA